MITTERLPNGHTVNNDVGLTVVSGLRGAACRTGVKPSADLDLAILVADKPMSAAGVFTRNAMAAPPVKLCRERLAASPYVRSLVINAGNANALTGQQGLRDARLMVDTLEACCGGTSLVLSTGVIGVPLPAARICEGIKVASYGLTPDFEPDFQHAMRTTDTCNKQASTSFKTAGNTFHVGGVAKGSGMIHPNMATMLAVVATDAPISPSHVQAMLPHVVDHSFHEISVDGDTSTNDSVLLFARKPEDAGEELSGEALEQATRAIGDVCRSLATQIVEDGEGATRIMEITVAGARNVTDARAVASAVACSSLVKTALAGGDPNWGRIMSAVGNAGVALSPEEVSLRLGDYEVVRRGAVQPVDAALLDKTFAGRRVNVQVTLGEGDAGARCLTTDLTKEYVAINADYTT